MKTTVRASVIIPDSIVRIQRLHDCGTYFHLEQETLTGHRAADFVEKLVIVGNRIDMHKFIDDDDLKEKTCIVYEYIA